MFILPITSFLTILTKYNVPLCHLSTMEILGTFNDTNMMNSLQHSHEYKEFTKLINGKNTWKIKEIYIKNYIKQQCEITFTKYFDNDRITNEVNHILKNDTIEYLDKIKIVTGKLIFEYMADSDHLINTPANTQITTIEFAKKFISMPTIQVQIFTLAKILTSLSPNITNINEFYSETVNFITYYFMGKYDKTISPSSLSMFKKYSNSEKLELNKQMLQKQIDILKYKSKYDGSGGNDGSNGGGNDGSNGGGNDGGNNLSKMGKRKRKRDNNDNEAKKETKRSRKK
jgi:hypothetical protein